MRCSGAADHTPPPQLQDITAVFVLGAVWSTEGAGNHAPSLNFYCWVIDLLLTPWDASRLGFNLLQSSAIGEGTSQGRAGHAETGAWCCPCPLWIRHLLDGRVVIKAQPHPQRGAVDSALFWCSSPSWIGLSSCREEQGFGCTCLQHASYHQDLQLSCSQHIHLLILVLLHFPPAIIPCSFE